MEQRRPVLWGELAVVAFLMLAYDRVSDLAALRIGPAVRRGEQLLQLERDLHVSWERSLDHLAAAHARLGEGLSLYYDLAHGLVSMGVLAAVFAWAPAGYRRARRALVAINLGALVVFVLLPVAPPRLLPGTGFIDVVAHSQTWSAWQNGSVVARHANEYASVPSLHVAWAFWVVLAVWGATERRGLRALALLHAVTTVAVVVLTGNHYLVDALAGALLAAACWRLSTVWPALTVALRAWAGAAARAPAQGWARAREALATSGSGRRQAQQEPGPTCTRFEVQVAASRTGESAGER